MQVLRATSNTNPNVYNGEPKMMTARRQSCAVLLAAVICTALCSHSQAAPRKRPAAKQERPPTTVPVALRSSLPRGVARHAAFVAAGHLYNVGGIGPQIWSEEILSSAIQPDGTLGFWQNEALMPDRRTLLTNSVQLAGDTLYVLGRGNGAFFGKVTAGGHFAGWQATAAYTTGTVSNQASCIYKNWLFVLGGRGDDNKMTARVASLQLDGPAGARPDWHDTTPLPAPIWYHMAGAHNGRVYVWGGLLGGNSETNPNVFSAKINEEDGSLGEWRIERPMPFPVYASAGLVSRGHLVSVAGRTSGGPAINGVQIARIRNDGTLTAWKNVPTELEKRMNHAAAIDEAGGRMYVVGGYIGDGAVEPERHTGSDSIAALNLEELGLGAAGETSGTASSPVQALTLEEALAVGAKTSRPVLAFFYSPEVPVSETLRNTLLSSPEFGDLSRNVVFAAVEASGEEADAFVKYSVFRVPCFVLLTPDGKETRKSSDIRDIAKLRQFLQQ
jgi:hypothetical protein